MALIKLSLIIKVMLKFSYKNCVQTCKLHNFFIRGRKNANSVALESYGRALRDGVGLESFGVSENFGLN